MTEITSLLEGVLSLVALLCTSCVMVGLKFWKHTQQEIERHGNEKVEELHSKEKSEFQTELVEQFLKIEEYEANDEPRPDGMSRKEHLISIINRDYDSTNISDVAEALEEVGESKRLWKNHYNHYKRSFVNFGKTAAVLALFGAVLLLGVLLDERPSKLFWNSMYALIGLWAAFYFYHSLDKVREAKNLKSKFDERWETYMGSD